VHTQLDGTSATRWVLPAEVGQAVGAWAAGTHTEGGTTYGLTWLGDAESDRVHHEVFGHQH